MTHTDFPILDADYSAANEHCGRVILDWLGYIEPHIDETDDWVAMPVRLVHTATGGFGIELGPYSLGTKDIDRLRRAITAYDIATAPNPKAAE